MRAIRFLGRRLHFPMTEYLDMPFSVFSDFLTDEVEAVNRGRIKPESLGRHYLWRQYRQLLEPFSEQPAKKPEGRRKAVRKTDERPGQAGG